MKTRFIDTSEAPEVFRTLCEYLTDHDFDTGLRLLCAAAECAGQGDLYQQWGCPGAKVAPSVGLNQAGWLAGKRGAPRRSVEGYYRGIPGGDHNRRITHTDGTRELLMQPYEVSWKILLELVEWCHKNGVEANIDSRSGHYPGECLAIRLQAGKGGAL